MKKIIILIAVIAFLIIMGSCSTEDSARLSSDVNKVLLVETNYPVDMIRLNIKNTNDSILSTEVYENIRTHVFNIDKGSKFELFIYEDDNTFNGKYRLTEDYGNILLLEDSFTNCFQVFHAIEEY